MDGKLSNKRVHTYPFKERHELAATAAGFASRLSILLPYCLEGLSDGLGGDKVQHPSPHKQHALKRHANLAQHQERGRSSLEDKTCPRILPGLSPLQQAP